MYRLVVLSTLFVISMAAPKPSSLVYSAPVLTPVAPHVVGSVVSPVVTSYSSYSNSVVHGIPVVTVPVVRQAPVAQVVPIIQETTLVHALPFAYPELVVA